MSLNVTASLTPDLIPAVEEDAKSSDGRTIYLMPESMAGKTTPKMFDLFLIQSAHNPVQCKFNPKVSVGHVWSPDPALPSSTAPFLATSAIVKVDIPKTPFWAAADFNPQLTGNDASMGPTPVTAPCPESSSDALLVPDNGWEITCLPVPGEELRVTHSTHGHGSFMLSGYHSCPGLSGGWIVDKRPHLLVGGAYVYDVMVEGALFTNLLATDWTARNIGEWCFLLRQPGANSGFAAETVKSPESGEQLTLIPLSILGV